MYKITLSSSIQPLYSEKLTYLYLNPNGCYSEFNQTKPNHYQPENPEGVCIRVPHIYEDEDGLSIATTKDVVYALYEGALNGTEEICSVEEIDGSMLMYQMQMNIEQLSK